MSKSDLKTAMDALQVRKPLRLQPTKAPVFTPPTQTLVHPSSQVENITQVDLATSDQKSTSVVKPTEIAEPIQVNTGTAVTLQTKVELSTQIENPTQANNPTQVAPPTPAENQTQIAKTDPALDANISRRLTEQDSSVVLEAQSVGKLERGYTRIPNSILMRLVSGDFTKNEIKLVLLIARFTISYQRKMAPLSKSVLERQTGLRGAAILEALAGLVSKGMALKEKGDQHRPNLLGLALPEGWDSLQKPSVETQAEKSTEVSKLTHDAFATSAQEGNPSGAGVENPTHLKDNERYPNKISLSTLPQKLQKYFSDLKPAKKKESEWRTFQELNSEYSADDIADCFSILEARGIQSMRGGVVTTDRCHSPMAFLSHGIGALLNEVQTQRTKIQEKTEREKREAEERIKQSEERTREVAEWKQKEQAFIKAFPGPDRQQEAISELCRGMPFRSKSEAGRTFAITKWWDSLKTYERNELLDF